MSSELLGGTSQAVLHLIRVEEKTQQFDHECIYFTSTVAGNYDGFPSIDKRTSPEDEK